MNILDNINTQTRQQLESAIERQLELHRGGNFDVAGFANSNLNFHDALPTGSWVRTCRPVTRRRIARGSRPASATATASQAAWSPSVRT